MSTEKDRKLEATIPLKNKRSIDRNSLTKVPTISFLRDQVNLCTDAMNVNRVQSNSTSWNSMFHHIVKLCKLECNFPPWVMPSCYSKKQTCGHTLQVELNKAATNSLYLTALDNTSHSTNPDLPVSVAAMFICLVIFQNPIWDVGLQHAIINKNSEKVFKLENERVTTFTSKCVCPCGKIFRRWHEYIHIVNLPTFEVCNTEVFKDHIDFVTHLYKSQHDYFHRIVLHLVQSTYSVLIAKLKVQVENGHSAKRFSSIHKGIVSLPSYIESSSKYKTFSIWRIVSTLLHLLYNLCLFKLI